MTAGATDWAARAREVLVLNRNGYLEAALQIGSEMADARAREIAQKLEWARDHSTFSPDAHGDGWRGGLGDAAGIARSTIMQPKTREQVLEEALREIAGSNEAAGAQHPCSVARRALEWKP